MHLNRFCRRKLPARLRDSRGGVLILGLAGIAVTFALAAITVDLLHYEGVKRRLQALSDAASLAATYEFKTRFNKTTNKWEPAATADEMKKGWDASKRAVFAVLKANAIPNNDSSTISVCDGTQTSCNNGPTRQDESFAFDASNDDYRFVVYDYPNLRVEIERGVYEGGKLTALEKDMSHGTYDCGSNCHAADDSTGVAVCRSSASPSCATATGDARIQDVTNSVRVSITVKSVPTYFAGILHIRNFSNVSAESISSLDS